MISEKEFSRRFVRGDVMVKYVSPHNDIHYYFYRGRSVYYDLVMNGKRTLTSVPSSMEVVDLYDEVNINPRYYSIMEICHCHYSKRCIL